MIFFILIFLLMMNIPEEILFDEIIPFLDIKTLRIVAQVNSILRNHIFKELCSGVANKHDIQKYINEKYSIKRKILNERKKQYASNFNLCRPMLPATILATCLNFIINIILIYFKNENMAIENTYASILTTICFIIGDDILIFYMINVYFRSLYFIK